jgi:rhomboid protease GluP
MNDLGEPIGGAQEPAQRQISVQQQAGRPIVTYVILGLTVFVYLLQEIARTGPVREALMPLAVLVLSENVEQALRQAGLYDQMVALLQGGIASDLLVLLGGKITPLIAVGQIWRLFTPALLHANLMHIAFNMYALYAIGSNLEGFYGHKRFLALYLLGAFGGNVLSFLLSAGVSVGASTAVFGLVAAQGVFVYQNRAMFGPQARAMLTNVVVIVVFNLILGLSPGIDNWGHLGGLIAGLGFAWFAGPLMALSGLWPVYNLVDQRSNATALVAGLALLIVFSGLAVLGISGR